MTIRSRRLLMASCLILVALLCGSVSAFDKAMFNAYELGTLEVLDLYANHIVADLKAYEQARLVTDYHRKQNLGHDHADQLNLKLCTLAFRIINTQRVISAANQTYRMVPPVSLQSYQESVRSAYLISKDYLNKERNCTSLSSTDYDRFLNAAIKVRDEQQKAHALAVSRWNQAPGFRWSNTLSVELSPLPIKLELLEGAIKLKFTRSIGPLKFDFQTGPKLSRPSEPTGLKYLVIKLPDRTSRILNIEGLELTFSLPYSQVTIKRNTLTIECAEQCLAAFQ